MQCPCGSMSDFSQCCFLLINRDMLAHSPEQLMRSRYSAYATNSADYIYQTYAKISQAEQSLNDIESWASQTKWLKLTINSASDFVNSEKDLPSNIKNSIIRHPTVCFSAYYQHQGLYFKMKERSRFILEDNQWRYLDGEVNESEELVTPNRNDLCFCQSQKKFKRCCGA